MANSLLNQQVPLDGRDALGAEIGEAYAEHARLVEMIFIFEKFQALDACRVRQLKIECLVVAKRIRRLTQELRALDRHVEASAPEQ